MGKYFGTDGFRGEVGVTLTSRHAFLVGMYLGQRTVAARGGARVAIGKDTRRSSYTLEYALAAGLTAVGAEAHILHVTTTPSVSFVTRSEGFDLGVMISASHNPFADNGIKLFDANGEKMDDAFIAELEAYLDAPEDLPLATGARVGCVVDAVASRNRYIGHLISLATVSYRGYRVGLDTANGAAFAIAKSVFDALGASTYVIHNTPNGCNINENAGSTHVEALRALVRDNALDVGFAFDGDADRCIAVDGYGNVVDGDAILYLCARDMKRRGELEGNTVVATVASNMGLKCALATEGIEVQQTDVGDRFVYERMRERGYTLGGEQSGHIIFGKLECTGDGLVTAIRVMELICGSEQPLSRLAAGYTPYPQVQRSIRVRDKAKCLADRGVLEAVRVAEERLGGVGRLLVRPSGTEPVIRIMAEAPCEETALQAASDITRRIAEGGFTV